VSSPIARGLMGKSAGDDVEIRTPKGVRECSVVKVEFV
jgi:transcription elongation factor GreA